MPMFILPKCKNEPHLQVLFSETPQVTYAHFKMLLSKINSGIVMLERVVSIAAQSITTPPDQNCVPSISVSRYVRELTIDRPPVAVSGKPLATYCSPTFPLAVHANPSERKLHPRLEAVPGGTQASHAFIAASRIIHRLSVRNASS